MEAGGKTFGGMSATIPRSQEEIPFPKVSIIMPAYNADKTIGASIQSVQFQTFQAWELLVVDDCSSDETASIARAFAAEDSRISFYINEKNMGVAKTRNFAMDNARGEWIAFLDSDDVWTERKLEKQLKFAEETNATITYTGTAYMDEMGKVSDYILPAKPQLTLKTLLSRNIMSCSSVMVRRNAMIPFPQDEKIHEDYAVWMQLVQKHGHAYGLDEPLLIYRMSGESKSSRRFRSAIMTYNAYRKAGNGRFVAVCLTLRYSLHSISKRVLIRRGRM